LSAIEVIGIAVLGGIGAVGRVAVSRAIATGHGLRPAMGTLAVNLSGSFGLGVLAGMAVSRTEMLLAGGALLGAYTTFSTLALEGRELSRERGPRHAAALFAVSLAAGLFAIWLGRELGGLL
jgi:CrcB protein